MSITFIIALALAIPFVLFPAAFVWYLDIGGINRTLHGAGAKGLAAFKKTN